MSYFTTVYYTCKYITVADSVNWTYQTLWTALVWYNIRDEARCVS